MRGAGIGLILAISRNRKFRKVSLATLVEFLNPKNGHFWESSKKLATNSSYIFTIFGAKNRSFASGPVAL